MGRLEYDFYVTVLMSFDEFKGIKDSGDSFKKIWDEKGYEEKVRVIALNDDGVLTSKTPEAFASWFSRKLANGYLRWCKLNRPAMHAAAAAGATTTTVDSDAYTTQSEEEEEVITEEGAEEVHTTDDEDEVDEARDGGEAAMATNGLMVVFGDDDDEKEDEKEKDEKEKDEKEKDEEKKDEEKKDEEEEEAAPFTPVKRSLSLGCLLRLARS